MKGWAPPLTETLEEEMTDEIINTLFPKLVGEEFGDTNEEIEEIREVTVEEIKKVTDRQK